MHGLCVHWRCLTFEYNMSDQTTSWHSSASKVLDRHHHLLLLDCAVHTAASSRPPGVFLLTHELLVQVLALPGQKDRLTSCALVSTAWHAAAVAATSKVVLSARTPDDLDSLLLYLRKYGVHVRKVLISKAPEAAYFSQLQSLPPSCSQLEDLNISACNRVDLPSVLSDLTSLTRLDISDSGFTPAAPACLVPLSNMTALQHLKCTLQPSRIVAGKGSVPFPAGVLSHLTSLTHLDLGECEVNAATMGGIERLTSLRECKLGAPGPGERRFGSMGFWQKLVKREAVAAVSMLQQLSLLSITSTYDISSRTAPGLSTLTSLKDLSFKHCHRVETAGLLEPLTALTRLLLQDMDLLLPQLLRVLPLLQQLEVLVVYGNHMRIVGVPLNPCYEDFAALTASSKLKKLWFQPRGTPLPPTAFAALFGGIKQLTALTDLMFVTNPHDTQGLGTAELQVSK